MTADQPYGTAPESGPPPASREFDDSVCIEAAREAARRHFEGAGGSHDWDHTRRVVQLCRRIGPLEHADMTVLLMAAYLHDIGRCHPAADTDRACHAQRGAVMAQEIVSGLPLSAPRRDQVVHCVMSHRYRGEVAPASVEARVLFDADKLDAIGAVGVARAFQFAGELGAHLHCPDIDVTRKPSHSSYDTGYREYRVKLCHIKDRMLTTEGKRLAADRHRFMTAFFDRFLEEVDGKC